MQWRTIQFLSTLLIVMLANASRGDVLDLPADLTSLEFVTVGNAGNAPDATGLGAVGYAYRLGKYDVTAAQYVAFLNSVAQSDPFGLYSPSMAGGADCGIQRSGVSGSFSYSVDVQHANRPVNFVSFGNAARFCNWLTNGQPAGSEDLTTTEDGSYYLNGATDNAVLKTVTRKANARFVLPTQDEWYKAAFHKNDGVTGDYWAYPTQSDTPPVAETPPGSDEPPGSANYMSVTGPTHLTNVGAYTHSLGPYGTFDQGGLLYQWTDSLIAPAYAGYSGFAMFNSSFLSGNSAQLRSDYRVWPWSPGNQFNFMGFRAAALPVSAQWLAQGNGTWGDAANWNTWAPQYALDTATFGDVAGGDPFVSITLGGSRTVGHIVFSSTTGRSYTLTRAAGDTTSVLFLDNGSDPATITVGDGLMDTIDVPIVLSSDLVIDVGAGSILTISGTISDQGSLAFGLGSAQASLSASPTVGRSEPVPEPASALLLALGASMLLARRRGPR
jgi:formylglycine-generating enzyme required for sulfatase activity